MIPEGDGKKNSLSWFVNCPFGLYFIAFPSRIIFIELVYSRVFTFVYGME
jgi:hypothetical protein